MLDVKTLPLGKKILIEASAGTGKTFAIGLIVLRLLLEKGIKIEKIVLITFTEAATAELRKKTAEKILEAYNVWETCEDDDLGAIIKNAKNSKDAQKKKADLQEAIARIDEMPVFTIHGFCKRLLSEFAFETQNYIEKEIIANQSELENRVVADFWRNEIKSLSEAEVNDLPEKFSPDIIKAGIRDVLNFPNAKIKYEPEGIASSENLVAKLQHKLATDVLDDLRKEKECLNVMCFGDLIENAYRAVENDNEKILFNAVQKKYDAILIDEFQDTDKMQYKIFSYLFKGKPFFMIGDPKQAIYRFRGGDIYAYLNAKSELNEEEIKTMKINFRSQKRLLLALNKIFKVDNPFERKEIPYIDVDSGKKLQELKINGKEQKPFVAQNIEYKNKGELKPIIKDIVREITRLLYETRTEIQDGEEFRRIKAQDIAILARTNTLAKEYRDALKENKKTIPAVIRRSDSVFKSDAADYMMRLLTAFANSQKEQSVKAALMDAELCIEGIKPFAEAFEIWKKHGIMQAINSYFDLNNLWGKIRSAKNAGERNATNLRQLISILNEEENVFGRVPERMLRRFAELMKNAAGEEYEEKLETDDDAVQIMTIHTSKGLQFPIVFVPDIMLAGEMRGIKVFEKEPPVYHSGDDIIIEYEISNRKENGDNAKAKEKRELLEESARNFYVAVTRPIYRLYVVNAYKAKAEKSTGQKICGQISEDENIEIANSFAEIEYPKNKALEAESESAEHSKPPKRFHGKKELSWQRTSFTGISRYLEHKDYVLDLPKTEIPAGTKTGILLHSIFEKLDFDASEDEIKKAVEIKLGGYKEFSKKAKEEVVEMAKIILDKPLQGRAGKLSKIKDSNKSTELEFFMSSKRIDLGKIKNAMKDSIGDFETEELSDKFKYIKGAIDLVFLGNDGKYYILDWKSNSLNDFTKEGMEEAMRHHGYHLQYCIYAVALKRWLERTQKNFDFRKQFGGAYYVFIRGVNRENFDGIYFSDGKNAASSIDELDILLA